MLFFFFEKLLAVFAILPGARGGGAAAADVRRQPAAPKFHTKDTRGDKRATSSALLKISQLISSSFLDLLTSVGAAATEQLQVKVSPSEPKTVGHQSFFALILSNLNLYSLTTSEPCVL